MIISDTKKFEFEMAHQLENCFSDECKQIHGHSYKLEVTVTTTGLDDAGMVCDFKRIKELVKPIIDMYDHKFITKESFGVNPTAENMAIRIFHLLDKEILSATWKQGSSITLRKIRLYETANAYVDVEK